MAGYMGGVRRGAMGGLSQLAQALAQGPQTERAAYDAEMGLQSKVAQALAQIRQADAGTAKTEAETRFLEARPDLYEEQAALAAGVDVPTVRAFRQRLTTGQAPQVPMGPEAPDGGMGVGSMQFDPAQAQRLTQALQRMFPVTASGAPIGANDWAGALDKFRDQDLSNEILAGTRAPEAVGRAQAAMAGKPLFSVDGNGQVVDLFRGAADASGQVPQGRVRLVESQAAENEAQRQRAIAEAERARAEAARARAESGAQGKPPPGYRWNAAGQLEAIPGGPADPNKPKPAKPLPPAALKLQQEELDAIGTFSGLDSDLAQFQQQIKDGSLNLGAVANLLNTGRNFAGMSTEQSRNLASFKAKLENMRNAVLLLNKGVQTEGDAQRAMNEIMANINDPKLVAQRLDEIRRLNARAVTLRQNNIEILRRNYEAEPLDMTPYTRQPAAVGGGAGGPVKPAGGGWKIERVN